MNPLTHFLISFNVLFAIFHSSVGITEIAVFSMLFGVLIDMDAIAGIILKRPRHHLRTWVQEPFGLFVIGLPVAILLASAKPQYFFLTMLPFALHILSDYMAFHEACPFAPFSRKKVKIGFIKPFPATACSKQRFIGKAGISEAYVLLPNIFIAIALLILFM